MTALPEPQLGTVIRRLKPFSYVVRLEDAREIICGLERAYFGRILPGSALRRLGREGPHEGDRVTVQVFPGPDATISHGVILRQPPTERGS